MPSLEDEFNILKMIVLIEQDPLTDNFVQVMLTQDQYKKLTKFFVKNKSKGHVCGDDTCGGLTTSDRFKNIYIPNIPHMYSEDDLENPLK